MNVVAWIVIGLVAGWIANRYLNYEAPQGRIGYLLFGVIGAFMGVRLLAPAIDPTISDQGAFSVALLAFSATGAATVLLVGNALKERFFP